MSCHIRLTTVISQYTCLLASCALNKHMLAVFIQTSCSAGLSCMTNHAGTFHDACFMMQQWPCTLLISYVICHTGAYPGQAYQHSPEQVRIVGGVDAHHIPICCVVLPSADDINPEDTVHRCAPQVSTNSQTTAQGNTCAAMRASQFCSLANFHNMKHVTLNMCH